MVFMSMGDEDALDVFGIVTQVLEIGDDVIHPQHIIIGKHQTGIDDQDLPVIFIGHHILADFSESPNRNNS